ncbi:MAG TPA: hypothetical protein PLI43_02340 [Albidovulum sp.]|uniref:hypothetical protein n=1 Tax=Albidovulum sp. TaxID=1872424 RepID=UPI002CBF959D|nr:hypothetical protein [Albidovulum sp.]
MKLLARTLGAALLVLLLGAPGARAKVTAAEVWQVMTDFYAAQGRSLTSAGQRQEGDTLIITGARFGAPREVALLRMEVPELRLRELGDGRVEISASDRITATVKSPVDGRYAAGTRLDLTKTGGKAIVSGSTGDMAFDFDAPEMTVATSASQMAGRTLPVRVTVTLTEGKGKVRITGTSTFTADTAADFATLRFDVTGTGNDAGDAEAPVHVTGTLNGVKHTRGLLLPAGTSPEDMPAALAAGYKEESRLRFASGNVNADIRDGADISNLQAGLADGEVSAVLGRDGVVLALRTGASHAVLQMPELPVPAEAGFAETRLSLSMPVAPETEAKPFATLFKLSDLTLSEGVWAMFDPTADLPRDPMTAIVDVSGRMRLYGSLLAEADEEGGKLPAEVEAVSLNELRLSALGAEVTGKGAATIDGSSGQPVPIGTADVDMKGLGGLIGKLADMGLLPQEQAMGLRMSLALFTVPTGEDSAKSRIESDAEGNVRVNGQVLYKFPKAGSDP